MRIRHVTSRVTLLLLIPCLLGAAPVHSAPPGSPATGDGSRTARHIILFVGDGMHLENEIAASRYLFGRDDGLSFHGLPYRNNASTWDVTTYNQHAHRTGKPPYDPSAIEPKLGYDPALGGFQPYPLQRTGISRNYFLSLRAATDSAASATAMSTGHKTDAGRIAWGPSGFEDSRLPTIAELLRQRKGTSIGVVSTVPFSHATPAAFVSHGADRGDMHAISREILLQSKPEVVIGGGHPCWFTKAMPWELYVEIKTGGRPDYVLVERVAGEEAGGRLSAASQHAVSQGRRLLGLFGGTQGNFESPLPLDRPGRPAVERATRENPLLQEAALAALQVLSRDPDGFFLLVEQGDIDWANQDNDYRRMIGCLWDLHTAVEAVITFVDQPGDAITWDNTLLIVTSDHANGYLRLNPRRLPGLGDLPTQIGRIYPRGEISFGATDHTNELVRVYARGAGIGGFSVYEGRWYSGTRLLDNTHIFHVMTDAAGIPQSSPLRILPPER